MSAARVLAIVRRVVTETRRDRPSLGLLFIAPVLITGLVSFILRGTTAPSIDVAVVNATGPAGTIVARALEASLPGDAHVALVASEAEARDRLATDSSTVIVVLPSDLTAGTSVVRIVTTGLDPAQESAEVSALARAVAVSQVGGAGRLLPTVVHETLYGVGGDDPVTAFAPAIVGFFAYLFVYMLTGVSFLRERTGGTLERLLATPVTRSEIVAGYSIGFALYATAQVIVLILWALGSVRIGPLGPLPEVSVGLGVAVAGSPALAFLVVLVLALGAVSLGIFLSTFARTELQIIQFIPLVLAPQVLLSGVLVPVSSLPGALHPVAALMPLTYAVDGLRQVFVRGADLGVRALQVDLGVLLAFGGLFALVASLTIRREVA